MYFFFKIPSRTTQTFSIFKTSLNLGSNKVWSPWSDKELKVDTIVPRKLGAHRQVLKFESLIKIMFDFLSPGSNKGLRFETLVLKKFDFLNPESNKRLKFEFEKSLIS